MIKKIGRLFGCLLLLLTFSGGCAVLQLATHNRYIGDKDNMVYHEEHCDSVRKIRPGDALAMPDNACARYEGFKPCPICQPDK